jgi:hypothetical protein
VKPVTVSIEKEYVVTCQYSSARIKWVLPLAVVAGFSEPIEEPPPE